MPASREPLTDSQSALAATHIPLARELASIAARHYPALRDEYESDACFALIGAAREWREDRECSFSSFAYKALQWSALRTREAARPLGYRKNRDAPPMIGRLSPLVGGWYDERPKFESDEAFESLLSLASPRYREILRMRFGEDLMPTEIGQRLGKSRQVIENRIRRGLAEIREATTSN